MSAKIWVGMVLLSGVCLCSSYAGEGTAASPDAAKNIGPSIFKAYTFKPIHPDGPDHVWLDEGNGRVQFMMFDKPVSDPTALLLFVGQGVKGTFCAESQPDGGKTGFNHFHRTHTPATGDTSMHGSKGEEGFWLKHVAVAEFVDEHSGEHAGHGGKTHYKPGQVENTPQPPTPKCH